MKVYCFIFAVFFFFNISSQNPYNNEDFESSTSTPLTNSLQVSGWVLTNASNNNQQDTLCNKFCDSLLIPIKSYVINHSPSAGYIDTIIGAQYPIFSVFGSGTPNAGGSVNPHLSNLKGTSFLRISSSFNNENSGIQQASKKIFITPANCVFKYAYIFVGNDLTPCCFLQNLFKIRAKNLSNNLVISNFNRLIKPHLSGSNSCGQGNTGLYYDCGTSIPFSSITNKAYNRWEVTQLDLTNFIGDTLRFDFCVNDRVQINFWGSGGYAYLDTETKPGMIYANGNISTSATFSACASATLSALPNYTYSWNGPAGSNINNNSNQTIVVSTSGVYNLTLMQGASIVGTQSINVNIVTPLPVNFTSTKDTLCKGQTTTLTINYSHIGHLTSYTWSTGSFLPYFAVSPSISTSYYINAHDTNGCLTSFMKTIHVTLCSGIEELPLIKNEVFVFPNPNPGEFTIKTIEDDVATLYDNIGRIVDVVILNKENNYSYHFEAFKPGMYLIKTKWKCFKLAVSD